MGIIGTAYGCIFCRVGGQSNSHFQSRSQQTENALRTLPVTDDYPGLTRNMFSITAKAYPEPGLYQYQLVHFGLSLKDAHEEWDLWIRKFERLLTDMPWEKAELRLELEPRPEQSRTCFDFRWDVPLHASPSSREQWLRQGDLPYSRSRERFKKWVAEQKAIQEPFQDPELMQRWIVAYLRINENEKSRALYESLRELDPRRAQPMKWYFD